MPCFHPLQAFRAASGEVVWRESGDVVRTLTLPCGRCLGCRLERARQWSIRCMHEARSWPVNSFVTLTYDDDQLPSGRSLRYSDFQRFMKRLRKARPDQVVRFFMCGEYGEETLRPHYHAALFNENFGRDRTVWRKGGSGFVVYRSAELERLWPFGMSSIGELTRESAEYIARYVVKKVTGERADAHYRVVDPDSGEVSWRVPEFVRMSLKPIRPGGPGGVGASWFERFGATDVAPHDRVVFGGRSGPVPRYYDKLLERSDPDAFEVNKMAREARARERWQDNTPERLAVREQVCEARAAAFRRKLK